MASPERYKEGLTIVDRRRQKKRKAEHFYLLHTPLGSSSLSAPRTTTHPKPSNFDHPNTVPVIFRDADPKFQSVKQVMRDLSHYHPGLRVSRVKDLSNKIFIIGNIPRDVLIFQSEIKMKACVGQNVKISFPKDYETKEKSKTFVVKGVPCDHKGLAVIVHAYRFVLTRNLSLSRS